MSLTRTTLLCSISGSLLAGCVVDPPGLLIEARAAYATSSGGLASRLTPTELYDAKKSLDRAEQEFIDHGDTLPAQHYAYMAKRKAELADVRARTEQDRLNIATASKQGVMTRDEQAKSSQEALTQSRAQLTNERTASRANTAALTATNVAQGQELQKSADRLELERQARLTSEAKLAAAMRDLATVAAIREDARGTVITLSGSVLFGSGQYALLETAKAKLDQVAVPLKEQSEDKRMVVEGHTDSQGSEASNQVLSMNRANAVRDYLVGRGVDAQKISAVGFGASKPLFDNRTAENRANNRRVEIVISPSPVTVR